MSLTPQQRHKPRTSRLNSSGSALIEAMLCLFLLSITMLAAAMVQINSVRQANGISARTAADATVRKMLEAMRSNPAGIRGGFYDSVSATVTDPACISTGCSTASNIANTDIFNFYYDITHYLPNGSASISGSGGGSSFAVTVGWTDPATNAAQSWVVQAVLP